MKPLFGLRLWTLGFLVLPVCAQTQQTPPTRTTTPPAQTGRQSRATSNTPFQRPVELTGKVVLHDGNPAPPGVRVELVLSGEVRRQEITHPDGSFTFDMSSAGRSVVADSNIAGEHQDGFGGVSGGNFRMEAGEYAPGMGTAGLAGWEIRANLPGYTSQVITLSSTSGVESPDVGTIRLTPLGGVKATTVSILSAKAPKDAVKSYDSARAALGKEKPDLGKASKELDKAVKIYPEYSAAWYLLGEVRSRDKNLLGAKDAFEKSIAADPAYLSPYLALANLEVQQNHWPEAAKLTQQALQLNPYAVRGHFLNAMATFNLNQLDAAETSLREVLKSNEARAYPLAHYILGAVLTKKGDIKAAASELRIFVKEQPSHRHAQRVSDQLSQWEKQGVIQPEAKTP